MPAKCEFRGNRGDVPSAETPLGISTPMANSATARRARRDHPLATAGPLDPPATVLFHQRGMKKTARSPATGLVRLLARGGGANNQSTAIDARPAVTASRLQGEHGALHGAVERMPRAPNRRKTGSHETRRWREMDSNPRSPVRGDTPQRPRIASPGIISAKSRLALRTKGFDPFAEILRASPESHRFLAKVPAPRRRDTPLPAFRKMRVQA